MIVAKKKKTPPGTPVEAPDKQMEIDINSKLHEALMTALRGGAEYDYDSGRSCHDPTCYPCHHSVITNTSIKKASAFNVSLGLLDALNFHKVTRTPLMDYCMSRIIAATEQLDDPGEWKVKIQGGWYGDYVDGVELSSDTSHALEKQLRELLHMNDRERMEYTLINEYSFLLDSLNGVSYDVRTLPYRFVTAENRNWQNRLSKKKVEAYKKYLYDRDDKDRSILPVGLALHSGGGYSLLDGFHRHAAMGQFLRENKHSAWHEGCPFVVAER